ncbi:DUF3892 domain-containing protein [Chitinophaga rhizosphaerae]|uniref:DUF3892 domain-containing protein n=1 Tax=Chitinophaga rhizosphaerae TaxID=1864947 RepID=UPI000F7FFA29|nr:DUF3892 domain-containing protein [Chitinophaga rhizosphaerae]
MADLQITCINKTPRDNPYDGITHVGGHSWKLKREDAIAHIKDGTHSFYTLVRGNRGEVGVVEGPNGKYLRTYADGKWNDNLLALPECF